MKTFAETVGGALCPDTNIEMRSLTRHRGIKRLLQLGINVCPVAAFEGAARKRGARRMRTTLSLALQRGYIFKTRIAR